MAQSRSYAKYLHLKSGRTTAANNTNSSATPPLRARIYLVTAHNAFCLTAQQLNRCRYSTAQPLSFPSRLTAVVSQPLSATQPLSARPHSFHRTPRFLLNRSTAQPLNRCRYSTAQQLNRLTAASCLIAASRLTAAVIHNQSDSKRSDHCSSPARRAQRSPKRLFFRRRSPDLFGPPCRWP